MRLHQLFESTSPCPCCAVENATPKGTCSKGTSECSTCGGTGVIKEKTDEVKNPDGHHHTSNEPFIDPDGPQDEGEKVETAKGNIYTWAEADRDYSMYGKFTYEGGEFTMYYDPQMGQFDNREPIEGDPKAQQVIDSLPDEYFANDEKETVISGIIDMILEYADPQTEELNDLRKRAGLEVRAVSEESLHEESFDCDDKFFETYGWLDADTLEEAEYQGRKVKLNKPMQGDVKKFKVYVKDPKTGNVKKVNFGQGGDAKGGTMRIRKSNPKARKSFRARHNCENPGPKTKARYWSCRKW